MRTVRLLAPIIALLAISPVRSETVGMETLDLSRMTQGYGQPQVGKSVSGKPLSLGGETYDHGIGSHANSTAWFTLDGRGTRFQALVGVDDHAGGPGSVVFQIRGDGRELWQSGSMKPGDQPKKVDVDLSGIKTLLLEVTDGGDGIGFDHADWVDARFVMSSGLPVPTVDPDDAPVILTPKPGPAPRINGPTIYGAHPGNPFLYRVPCQGHRPIRFSADGLPDSLKLDAATGIITGTTPPEGTYRILLHAGNEQGESSRLFRLVAGETLALTPPMGWNHWYTHYDRITDKLMREAADAMVSSGMADVGYQYVNIDDCWMNAPSNKDPLRVGPMRDANGDMQPNKHFPDMKGLTDFIHGKGLKAGIYTSPGRFTCAGFAGSYAHERQDAERFATWGFDFLKHDWCSYGSIAKNGDPEAPKIPNEKNGDPDANVMRYPYQLMGSAVREQTRDIVFNLCQYGMGNVWEWGADVGGHCWRTAGDLGFELDRFSEVAIRNAGFRAWNRPGAWNDPDYIQIGYIGNARGMGEPEPCSLTPNQQYAYMSLWSLSAAPIFFSGDMGRLDEFTLNILCNAEVIDVNQDALGQCGEVISVTKDTYLMVKDLEDGGKAVGFFNRGGQSATVSARWAVLGLSGRMKVRDVWRQKDLADAEDCLSVRVPRRGVVMLRLTKPR